MKKTIGSILAVMLTVSTFAGSFTATAAAQNPGVHAADAAAVSSLPPLDLRTMREVLSGLPNSKATAALVYVGTPTDSWMGASGVADIASNAPARADGRFRIGSITKVFTAAVVLQLAAEQTVDLNKPIQHYLPGLLPSEFPPVLVGQLLNYTSGLPSPVLPDHLGDEEMRYKNWTPQELAELAFQQPMEFEPGTRQHYTNINYVLAGLLIEKVTGNPYEVEVQSRILQPLGLYNTYLPGSDVRMIGTHAKGYQAIQREDRVELEDVTEGSQSFTWAAGQIISTTNDLNVFMTALFRGEVVPKNELEHMFTVPDVPVWSKDGADAGQATMSMGMMRTEINGMTFWGKTGARPGYANGMFATRDLQRKVVYSVNSTDAKGPDQNVLGLKIGMAAFGIK
ncbi:D-aminopeptidase [Paenibacillus solanacearum]|uniref:D-aminopeptidase n=1 Tax=Paenibacillus solanacearum TaxID=2048548 RepID=A0A916K881_9BACL|nr:serine hydrolase domain-containing protein [Paenibacillus solanacearum]CAG7649332.1 D-aminopeptidase [Paenibacillus solanacearum]